MMEQDVCSLITAASQRTGLRAWLLRRVVATEGYRNAEKSVRLARFAESAASGSCIDHLLSYIPGVGQCAESRDAYNDPVDNAIGSDGFGTIPCDGDRVASGRNGDRLFIQAVLACVEENFWDMCDQGGDAAVSGEHALVATLGVLSSADGMMEGA